MWASLIRGAVARIATTETPEHPRTRLVFAWASFVAPFAVAIFGARSLPDSAHDEATLRVIGLSFTGAFRALDTWLAAPFMMLPLGTRAFRASLACAVVTGLASLLTYLLAEPLFAREGKPTSRLSYAVTTLGVVTAMCSPPWQLEGSAVGGTVTGAALVLLAATLGLEKNVRSARVAFVVGAAFGWEPLVGAMALVSVLVPLFFAGKMPLAPTRGRAFRMAAAFALGLVPFGLAFVGKAGSLALVARNATWQNLMGEGHGAGPVWKLFARDEIGWLFLAAAALGTGLTVMRKESRARAAVLLTLTLGFPLTYALDLAHGPIRFGAPMLASLAAIGALAGSGLYELVLRVRTIQVPFAPASAALLVVLEWTLPVRAADDSFARRSAVSKNASYAFALNALGGAPPAAIVLVPSERILLRLQSTRASGISREDLEFFPTFDLKNPLARDAVDREPKLAGLYRDLALGIAPEEWSLSSLAAARPLLLMFEPKWKPGLAKHLIPDGLFSRFEPEPQGQSDRRIAMEKASKKRAFLAQEVAGPGRDAGLQSLVAHLLRSRAIAMGAAGERENLSKALDELRPYAPDDPVASQLVRRTVTTRGAFDVTDLVP